MRVLLSGSTGLIGRHLVAALRAASYTVVPLVRNGSTPGAVAWSTAGDLSPEAVSGFDAVIHLAGEPVGPGRWTTEKKAKIFDSRVHSTQRLAAALGRAEQPPRVFLCASGINVYGECGDALLDESQPGGAGFLADVCRAWEAAAMSLSDVARVVPMRIGVVLAKDGGTLPVMLPLFRMGLGGPVGGGTAYLSWIGLHDLIRAMLYILASGDLRGPVNLVAPQPVTNRAFTSALGAALHRPALIPVPAWAVRLLLGQFAEETVLSSVRAVPARLLASGFLFHDPHLAGALQRELTA